MAEENTKTIPTQVVDESKTTEPVPAQAPRITLDQLINLAIEKDASDIHFGEGSRVALRVKGKIVFIENVSALSKAESEGMIHAMLTSEDEKKRLERVREVDFSYTHSNGVSFRVNVFYRRNSVAAVMRMISKNVPTMEELGVPEKVKELLSLKEGLILVCGAAGSGKSTTIQAMLEHVNENFVKHIITIENPIEYIFEEKKSMFSQRELGKDTLTLSNALHSAIREDPNLIMVSEINDMDTLDQVLTLVETGHLVVASMLTKDSRQTIERMVNLFPQEQRNQVQERIADNVVGILSQDLVDRADQTGRVAVYELLIANSGTRNVIRHGNLPQLRTAIQSGSQDGMITMDTYAYQLGEQGVISQETVQGFIEETE